MIKDLATARALLELSGTPHWQPLQAWFEGELNKSLVAILDEPADKPARLHELRGKARFLKDLLADAANASKNLKTLLAAEEASKRPRGIP